MSFLSFERGASRFVILVGKIAIKFPRGLRGLRCNVFEKRMWLRHRSHPSRGVHLCPVIFSLPAGILTVMPRTQALPSGWQIAEWDEEDWWDYRPGDDTCPWEYKAEDWGVWRNNYVAVDYAAPALFR